MGGTLVDADKRLGDKCHLLLNQLLKGISNGKC